MRRLLIAACTSIGACSAPERSAETFTADPEAAASVVAECDAGRTRRDWEEARRGLAEARRQARMAAYARTF